MCNNLKPLDGNLCARLKKNSLLTEILTLALNIAMSNNIITRVQESLQYPPLRKIDPNTEQVADPTNIRVDHSFGQAAIPAILAAFTEYVQSDEGASDFLHEAHSGTWIQMIFGDRQDEVVQAISAFTPQSNEDPFFEMQSIANEIVRVTKEQLPENAAIQDVKNYFQNEKVSILSYLLPELKVGVLLENDSMDDRTHKMDGPISGLVQSIGAAFDNPEVAENKV